MAEHAGCLTQHLLEYFGEMRAACRHCSRCGGEPGQPLAGAPGPLRDQVDIQVIRKLRAEGHDALQSPRQLARFLCGISSPATTRAKLRNRPEFGQWTGIRFADALAFVQAKRP